MTSVFFCRCGFLFALRWTAFHSCYSPYVNIKMFMNDSVCVLFFKAVGCLVPGSSELWFHSILGFKFAQQKIPNYCYVQLQWIVVNGEDGNYWMSILKLSHWPKSVHRYSQIIQTFLMSTCFCPQTNFNTIWFKTTLIYLNEHRSWPCPQVEVSFLLISVHNTGGTLCGIGWEK